MASNPKLKVSVGMDHGQFDKGALKVKQDLRSLESVASDKLTSIGNMFGVNLGKVQQLGEAVSGLGTKLTQAGSTGAQALGKVIQASAGAATAIAAIGIGGAVTAFKALNSEAEAFKNTVEGANIALQTQAYLDTYRQAMHDVNSETGKAVAEFEAGFSKWWGRFKQNVSSFTVNLITDDRDSGALKAAHPMVALSRAIDSAAAKTKDSIEAAKNAAAASEPIADRIYQIQRQQSDNLIKIAELDAEIAKERENAADSSLSQSQQLAAINRAQELIHQKYALQVPLANELADLMDQMNSLAASSPEQIDAANQQRVKAINLAKQESDEIRALLKRQGSLNAAVFAEAEARRKAAEALAESRRRMTEEALSAGPDMTAGAFSVSTPGLSGMDEWLAKQKEAADAYAAEVQRIQALNDQLNENFEQSLVRGVSESLETLADMMMRVEDLNPGAIFAALLTPIADSAMKAGEIIMAQGLAAEAFKESLSSLNGVAAITAGAALMTAAALAKSGLKALAGTGSGSYSANSYVASSSAGSFNRSDWGMAQTIVRVTGELTGSGSTLKAVIQNEDKRLRRTT